MRRIALFLIIPVAFMSCTPEEVVPSDVPMLMTFLVPPNEYKPVKAVASTDDHYDIMGERVLVMDYPGFSEIETTHRGHYITVRLQDQGGGQVAFSGPADLTRKDTTAITMKKYFLQAYLAVWGIDISHLPEEFHGNLVRNEEP